MIKESLLSKTEADQTHKIILPYLNDLGITADELEFEKSFKVRLGHNEHTKKEDIAAGRADILCKRGTQNLFIIEVKARHLRITDDDIEQGVSYARLVHPIAPFVIATNGKDDTRVIDTVSMDDMSGTDIGAKSEFWKNGCKLSSKEEIELRYEALINFIGYSHENLVAFSRTQVDLRMQTIKGSSTELHKKYIPELFLEKEAITAAFSHFLEEDSKCFALVGEAGVGKTNIICALAEKIIYNHVVVFYNAADIRGSIISSIKEDFNWIFTPDLEAPEIFRRLEALGTRNNFKVCIFIDAIDEATIPNFPQEIDELVLRLQRFNNIKLCVTCKDYEWNQFLFYKGNPTHLSENLYKPSSDRIVETNGKNALISQPGIYIGIFSEVELEHLDAKYRLLFKYDGKLTGEVKDECHLGFMLRVVSEVYQDQQLPEILDDIDLLKKYLDKKLEKLADPEIGRNCLLEIGNALFETEIEAREGKVISNKIEVSHLRRRLGLRATEKLPPELFAYNILTKIEHEGGVEFVGFYYSRIQDYVVAIHSLKLNSLGNEEFRSVIPNLFKGPVGQGVINWYLKRARAEHRKILLGFHQTRGLAFLSEYCRIIETHMPLLKDRFEPFTNGKIGLVMTDNPSMCGYGFRPIENADERLIETVRIVLGNTLSNPFIKLNVRRVKERRNDFIASDPTEAARQDIKEQLTDIINKGQLNEDHNIGIAIEKAIAIIYKNLAQLGYGKTQNYYLPRISHLLPIKCDQITKKVKFIYASKYYEDEAINSKIERDEIATAKSGSFLSYTLDSTKLDYKESREKAILAAESDNPIPEPKIIGEIQIFAVLTNAIRTIKTESAEITEPLFPPPDIPIEDIHERLISKGGRQGWIPDLILVQYSDEQLKSYIEAFFETFLREYRKVIEICFPTIVDKVSIPTLVYVEARTQGVGWGLTYAYEYNNPTLDIEVIINPEKTKFSFDDDRVFRSWHHIGLETIFWESQVTPLINVGSSFIGAGVLDSVSERCPMRNFIYDKIKGDMKVIFENLD